MAIIPYTLISIGLPAGSGWVSDRIGNLYVIVSEEVQQCDAATGAITNLSSPGDGALYVAAFQGQPYCVWYSGTQPITSPGNLTDLGISYHDGVSWNRVWTMPDDTVASLAFGLYALRDTSMVAFVGPIDIDGNFITPLVVYTTNGISWNSATVNGDIDAYLGFSGHGPSVVYYDTIYAHASLEYLGCGGPISCVAQIWKWTGNNWAKFVDPYGFISPGAAYPQLIVANFDQVWEYEDVSTIKYGDDFSNWTTNPTGGSGAMTPLLSDNMPYTFGQFYNGVSFFMQPWDNDALDWNDAANFDAWNVATHSLPTGIFRMNSGEVYAVTQTNRLLKRDQNIAESPDWGGGSRLWMYKSTDGGITWTSRGVKT